VDRRDQRLVDHRQGVSRNLGPGNRARARERHDVVDFGIQHHREQRSGRRFAGWLRGVLVVGERVLDRAGDRVWCRHCRGRVRIAVPVRPRPAQ